MTELQHRLLVLLKEIDEICKKHDIEYVLFAGTALGAQRHQGFIPWDDDADIIMTLDNYEKFMSVIKSELRPDRSINALEAETEGYMLPYARYVDLTSTAIQRHTAFGGCDPGVKVDIFFVVPAFNNAKKMARQGLDILAFSEMIGDRGIAYQYRPDGFYDVLLEHRKEFEKLGREGYIKSNLKKLKRKLFMSKEKYVLFSGVMSNVFVYDSKIFKEIEYVPFEDTQLPISRYNSEFSDTHFGIGWVYLPNNIFDSRHKMLVDLNRPFSDYLSAISKDAYFIESDANCCRRKQLILNEEGEYRDILKNKRLKKNVLTELVTNKTYAELDNGAAGLSDYLEVFGPYFKEQMNIRNKTFKFAINLNKEVFLKAMEVLIATGRYYEADFIINLNIDNGNCPENDEQILKLKETVEICNKLVKALYVQSDLTLAGEILKNSYDSLGNIITVFTAKCYFDYLMTDDAQKLENIINHIDEKSADFCYIGDLLTVKGLILEKLNRNTDAAAVYNEAIKTVANGYLFRTLYKKGIDISQKEVFQRKSIGKAKSYGEDFRKMYIRELKKRNLNSADIKKRNEEYEQEIVKEKKVVVNNYKEYAERLFSYKL